MLIKPSTITNNYKGFIMELGTHSTSLAVNDIKASKAFYEKLGFQKLEGLGSVEDKWLIMINGDVKIGLFEGMFENNIITFNPENARANYKILKEDGVTFSMESDSIHQEKGPCHFSISDPDGNQILFDQHTD